METCITLPVEDDQLHELVAMAKDWALSHGIAMRTADRPTSSEVTNYAPFLLFPSPFPKRLFDQACSVQEDFNLLYHKVAHDHDFLQSTLQSAIKVDDFTKRLWDIYETVRKEGIKQPICLNLNRNDFMTDQTPQGHAPSTAVDINALGIKEVEFNTIASSFAGLEEKVAAFHRFILERCGMPDKLNKMPANNCAQGLASGIVQAWELYGNSEAVVLFLTETVSRNIFDQRSLEWAMYQIDGKVKVLRRSFDQVYRNSNLTADSKLILEGREVAVVYFRCGYSPNDYMTEEDWTARLRIEQSCAIKSPSIYYHLAGAKKIQQELGRPGVLERFIQDPEAVARIRAAFAGMFSLERDGDGDAAVAMAMENPFRYVLKPQREGGGNNYFGEDVRKVLEGVQDSDDRMAYILMERIHPVSFQNYPLRAESPVQLCNMLSELGVYGVLIGTSEKVITNKQCGHLLRTKTTDTNEGGVATGYSAIDSPYLI